MEELLNQLWSYRINLVPVLLGWAATEWINLVRRWTRVFYTPMYVPFLLPELNQDLSIYYGQDIVGEGVKLDDAGAERVRRRLRWVAMLSMSLSVIVIPLVAGLSTAFFLSEEVFFQYLAAITLYRLWRCTISYRNFGTHALATRSTKGFLVVLYSVYTLVAAQLTYNSFSWARPYIQTGDWAQMLGKISNVVLVDGIVFAIIVAALSSLFANVIADPKIRHDQLSYLRDTYFEHESPAPSPQKEGQDGPPGAGNTPS